MQSLGDGYDDATRCALDLALVAADAAAARFVAPEHVLVGLLSESSHAARAVLVRAGATPQSVDALANGDFALYMPPDSRVVRVSHAPSTTLLIRHAQEEARQDGQSIVRPHHLLRALFAGDPNPAVDALVALGVTRAKLRDAPDVDVS